jgi:hypothetical protein
MVLTTAFLGASVLRVLGGDLTNPVCEDLLANQNIDICIKWSRKIISPKILDFNFPYIHSLIFLSFLLLTLNKYQ